MVVTIVRIEESRMKNILSTTKPVKIKLMTDECFSYIADYVSTKKSVFWSIF